MYTDIADSELNAAKDNNEMMHQLLAKHELWLLRCTSNVTHRYVTKNDDEYSVALTAFMQAIREYDADKGNFDSFARLVIKRRLIDHIRKEQKFSAEIPCDPRVFELDTQDESDELIPLTSAEKEQLIQWEERSAAEEIEEISAVLHDYGFDFMSLADCSPKAEKTKKACAKAVALLVREPALMSALRTKRTLPVSAIEKNCKIPRKIMERHRNYIIAAAEILTRDCPCLTEYLPIIRKECNK
ncbi:MAG: sigma factor [Anaerofustis sp.]